MKIEELLKSTMSYSLSRQILLNIMATQNILSEQFNEILKPYDLSSEQYNVLRILNGQQNKMANMCDIQERMVAKTSNTTRLVDKLLIKELVTRNVCPRNRRKIEVSITEKGMDILQQLEPKVIANEEKFTQNLSLSEQENLIELLEKYRTL